MTPACIDQTPTDGAPPATIHRSAKRRGEALPLHAHREGQLTYATSGMVQVHTADGTWLVPPQLAVWAPAGLPHRLDIITDAELLMVHWRPAAMRDWGFGASLDRPFALRVTPLLGALLNRAVTIDLGSKAGELVLRPMLHELTAMPDAPTFLPMPASPAGRRVADLVVADPRHDLDLAEIASRAGTSVRAVSRLFPAETGLTFKAWRQRARIVGTMELLARGDAPAKVARDAGFASTAAYCCAFRRVTATTPSRFCSAA